MSLHLPNGSLQAHADPPAAFTAAASAIAAAAHPQVLQYHVVPAGAVRSTQLKDGQQLTTSLKDASPLGVKINKDKVSVAGANVVAADIGAGKAIIHVVDQVLLPPSLVRKSTSG